MFLGLLRRPLTQNETAVCGDIIWAHAELSQGALHDAVAFAGGAMTRKARRATTCSRTIFCAEKVGE